MKKLMFLVSVAAIALTSCSNDENLAKGSTASGDALAIRPMMQATRGTVFTNTNFKEFKLDIVGTFVTDKDNPESSVIDAADLLGLTVKKQDDESWKIMNNTTPVEYYWKSKNVNGKFTAYAPTDFTPGGDVVIPAVASQKDIVVAYNEGVYNDFQNGVPLHFRHVLSQIQVKADNTSASDATNPITIKVKNIKFARIYSTSKLAMPTTSTATGFSWDNYTPWITAPSVATTYEGTDATAANAITLSNTAAQDITFGDPFLLMPQQLAGVNDLQSGAYLAVEIQANGKNVLGQDVQYPEVSGTEAQGWAWAAIPLTTLWKPGFKYIYTLHFSNSGIGKDPDTGKDIIDCPVPLTFDVKVIDWEEEDTPEERNM